jgi:hypothetical protein
MNDRDALPMAWGTVWFLASFALFWFLVPSQLSEVSSLFGLPLLGVVGLVSASFGVVSYKVTKGEEQNEQAE